MNRIYPVLVVLLIFGFAFIAQAIIGVKLLELRVKISRERILNYELSSRVLKEKFVSLVRSESQDFTKEVKQNILESAIMNDRDPEALKLSFSETVGYWVINAIRPLALKPFLHLLADQEELILMKYAFFMERNRRYEQAIEKYQQLLKIMPKDRSDARGFALLHTGYCFAVSGQTEEALEILEVVRKEFSGTHYSQTASTLIALLRDQKEVEKEIAKESLSNLEKARRYYERSLYPKAIRFFQKESQLKPMDQYRLFRSKEETGQVKAAIKGYLAIVKANRDPQAVREANRRLLLIGNFYGGGKKVKQFAEKKAQDLGDTKAVQEVAVAAESKRKDVILEEIREGVQSSGEKKADPMLAELGKELEENIVLEEKILQEKPIGLSKPVLPRMVLASSFRNPKPQFQVPDSPEAVVPSTGLYELEDVAKTALLFPHAELYVRLTDGRQLQGRKFLFLKNGTGEIQKQGFQSQVPLLLIQEIGIQTSENSSKQEGFFFLLSLQTGQKLSARKVVVLNEKGSVRLLLSDGSEKKLNLSELKELAFP